MAVPVAAVRLNISAVTAVRLNISAVLSNFGRSLENYGRPLNMPVTPGKPAAHHRTCSRMVACYCFWIPGFWNRKGCVPPLPPSRIDACAKMQHDCLEQLLPCLGELRGEKLRPNLEKRMFWNTKKRQLFQVPGACPSEKQLCG